MSNIRTERGRITTHSQVRKRKEATIQSLYMAHSNTEIQGTNSLKGATCQDSLCSPGALTSTVGEQISCLLSLQKNRKILIRKSERWLHFFFFLRYSFPFSPRVPSDLLCIPDQHSSCLTLLTIGITGVSHYASLRI